MYRRTVVPSSDRPVRTSREKRRKPLLSLSTPRASSLRALLRAYPRTATFALIVLAVALSTNVLLAARWWRYRSEISRLREGMTDAEKRRADMLLESDQNRFAVMVELIRRQARGDKELHVSITVDSGRMYLEREGIVLRDMAVEIGPDRVVGEPPDTVQLVAPRGQRTVEQIVRATDEWEVPEWVFKDRGLPVPENRRMKGVLGRVGIVLNGGTVIYAIPQSGPLADTSYVLPASIRASAEDLRAIAENVTRGMSVYFY
jgi:hypothetical protein